MLLSMNTRMIKILTYIILNCNIPCNNESKMLKNKQEVYMVNN